MLAHGGRFFRFFRLIHCSMCNNNQNINKYAPSSMKSQIISAASTATMVTTTITSSPSMKASMLGEVKSSRAFPHLARTRNYSAHSAFPLFPQLPKKHTVCTYRHILESNMRIHKEKTSQNWEVEGVDLEIPYVSKGSVAFCNFRSILRISDVYRFVIYKVGSQYWMIKFENNIDRIKVL